ncbi:MAG: hypothetical protein ABW318_21325 [Vicinamibacterales bacterium]
MVEETVPVWADDDMPTHPEEMKTNFDLRIGKSVSLQGSARITPAGVVTTGIMACLFVMAVAWARKKWRD